ncbi:MAG: GTPase [Clostridiales bacterium]|nr:GTPase [Clostridiales bacterium]
MAQEIPVYIFTGFMDSGKTSLVLETLFENDFSDGARGVIIACEDGDVEYDEKKLATVNFKLVWIENEEDFTLDRLSEINKEMRPEQVFIEYNGTWGVDRLVDEGALPDGWTIVQTLSTVDSTSFDLYLTNMRAMMQEQLFPSDVVIFNRTDDDTDRGHLRRMVKNINRKAQIVYERKDGTIDERPEELPFDVNQDLIELSDADYAIWYMDAAENCKKYDGKKVRFLALVYNPDKGKKGIFVPGRFAMTCCIEDVTFVGFKCKYDHADEIPHRSWIDITAEVKVEFAREYKGKGPVLYPVTIEKAEKPEDELVYFS